MEYLLYVRAMKKIKRRHKGQNIEHSFIVNVMFNGINFTIRKTLLFLFVFRLHSLGPFFLFNF